MNELDVFRLLLARRDNYDISEIAHLTGRAYSVVMRGKRYNAVILPTSFDFYQMRYHLAKRVPDLVMCFTHNTVIDVTCLSLKDGGIADPCDLPMGITDVLRQRHRSKIGSQCLLGQYLCGVVVAQKIVNALPPRSRRRYIERARELGKRRPGRPVDTIAS